jgi:hypothetical protein
MISFTDHIRQCVVDLIVALRQRKTPVTLALAQGAEEAINAIPAQAALFAREHGDGHPVLLGRRMVRFTQGAAYVVFETYSTLELIGQLDATLQKDLELADLTRVLHRAWKSEDAPASVRIAN